MKQKTSLQISFFLLAISVALGAIGAHLLEKSLTPKNLDTFNTGVKYLTYHSIALLLISTNEKIFAHLHFARKFIYLGIFFFTGNCIAYSLTSIKMFAMLVPIGGIAFITAWLFAIYEVKNFK